MFDQSLSYAWTPNGDMSHDPVVRDSQAEMNTFNGLSNNKNASANPSLEQEKGKQKKQQMKKDSGNKSEKILYSKGCCDN